MKIYEPSQEERAFIYQQSTYLEPLMKDLGSLTVLIETSQTKKTEKPVYTVTFVVAPEAMNFKIRGSGKTFYEAMTKAKDLAIKQLNSLVNALPAMNSNEHMKGYPFTSYSVH